MKVEKNVKVDIEICSISVHHLLLGVLPTTFSTSFNKDYTANGTSNISSLYAGNNVYKY